MSTLLVIAGPPGAGKSTVSSIASSRLSPSVLIHGDAFFRFLDQVRKRRGCQRRRIRTRRSSAPGCGSWAVLACHSHRSSSWRRRPGCRSIRSLRDGYCLDLGDADRLRFHGWRDEPRGWRWIDPCLFCRHSNALGTLLHNVNATPGERRQLDAAVNTPAGDAARTMADLPCRPLLAALEAQAKTARDKAGI